MIAGAAVFLFSAFLGASSTLLLAIPENPVHAITNQTAVLPVSLRFSTPPGEFFHLKWDFLSGHRPVLAYVLTKCSGGAPEWWQRSCQRSVKVAEEYQQQANVSLQSGSLVIQRVQPADAGTYQITVRGLDVFVTAEVNLTVTEAAAPTNSGRVNGARFSLVPNTVRLGLAGLVLCVLGLIVGEAVYKPAGCSPHHLEESQEPRDELETLD
ncbi:uncharacterized protein LOC123346610 [Mauremys mutica]|uniref:Immunoglobulin domain-containing protein n=1 Tax=Mauremys mutica TaxID=74926 RepID=A0A9D3XQA5_9SAUR|nr:uncharacterized protein LOC123346610 [Mauremys mutica]KAH1183265.1 hypothetical protein KIL84_004757 [Mauremys mutica]